MRSTPGQPTTKETPLGSSLASFRWPCAEAPQHRRFLTTVWSGGTEVGHTARSYLAPRGLPYAELGGFRPVYGGLHGQQSKARQKKIEKGRPTSNHQARVGPELG